MAIHLEKITPENWRLGLSVSYEQQGFVASDMILLARAYAYRESRSNAFMIHHDNCAIGMVLFYDCEERKAYEFSQLFIDERYQSRGYGKKAAELVLDHLKVDGKYNKVILCITDGNEIAKRLYEDIGFRLTGEKDGNEIILQKEI